jgi:hypothetical protein
MRQATAEMAAEYQRIAARSREDPGTAGDEGEENWAGLLRRWLPSTYHVATKGRILFSDGAASSQMDVVVLSPSYPTGLLNKKVYLAAGVLAAFECKNALRLGHVRRAVETGVRLRELARADRSVPHDILYGVLAHSHAVKSKAPENSIASALSEADAALVSDPRNCLDIVCVANLGTWSVMRLALLTEPLPPSPIINVVYMGPLDSRFNQSPHVESEPIGRFLTTLLRRLGPTDPGLALIANYLNEVGLFGVGQGPVRTWTAEDLPTLSLESLPNIY